MGQAASYCERAAAAEARSKSLLTAKLRVGTKDLRIAAIANSATLLSRNGRDFARIPGLNVEDWTL